MTHTQFVSILDECLARLSAGDSVDACLRSHPEHTAELRPLLETAARLRVLPPPKPGAAAVEAGKQRMLAVYRQQRDRAGSVPSLACYAARAWELFILKGAWQPTYILRFAMAVILLLFVGTNLGVVASAGSIPGDPLYGVKRSWEETRLALALRDQNRQRLQQEFLERRESEVREMQRRGRQGALEIEGVLQALAEDRWAIDGLAFQSTRNTRLQGDVAAGATARVRVQVLDDGTLEALEMRTLTRPSPLQLEPEPRRTSAPSGRVPTETAGNAPTESVKPAPQTPGTGPTPRPTAALEPTATPEPVESPVRTRCSECTGEPPGETQEPRETPETHDTEPTVGPAKTYEPDQTPPAESVESPEPEATAGPAASREPEPTPPAEPPETREPEHTVGPANTHEHDHTPEPVETHESDHGPTPAANEVSRNAPAPTAGPARMPAGARG